ncbi:Tetratricopeptide repeat-containing protein [Modicisalibacter muralis]|uniref:Tetratricopeptide repeat-containing protein n=1 Tax=Modicisalibacter muralis TaxID=119000 RepID=A0A1G9S240_9GAMM|nr:winged helix-turn-helix domain-containing protein [Halomonas muralis]SDM29337.1 Tetratricopeptide repeat-containing protein [Halomonas muralis]
MILRFDAFELDMERYELRQHGAVKRIEPMVFDLLVFFARHPHRVFTRDELIDTVWTGRFVSDATVASCVKSARKALGDSGATQTYLQTVRGRGFRFACDITQDEEPGHGKVRTRAVPVSAADGDMDPSLLVLPFRPLSESSDITRFADALAADLTTVLTRIPLLRLSTQSEHYRGLLITPSVREIHEALGVDYVLEGGLQAWEDTVRITAQLADARAGFCLWAEQFTLTGPLGSLLDDAVIAIIAKLEPQLHRAIYQRVCAQDGEHSARQLYLEASGLLALQGWRHDSFTVAADLLRRSWQCDPQFALAASHLSLVRGLGHRFCVLPDAAAARQEALEAAERSLQLDNMDSTVLGYSGCALADIGQVERALPILKQAIVLNPANAQAWAALGSACLVDNRVNEAITHLRHGIRISPLDSRLSVWGAVLAMALILAKDIDAAKREAEKACQSDDRCYLPRVVLGAVHQLCGNSEFARKALGDAYRIHPTLSAQQVSALVGVKLGQALLRAGANQPLSP